MPPNSDAHHHTVFTGRDGKQISVNFLGNLIFILNDNALLLPLRRMISHHKRRLFQFWRGRYGSEPPLVRFLSFSCSFQRRPCQIIGYFPQIQKLALPLLGILICHCKIYLFYISVNERNCVPTTVFINPFFIRRN